MKFILYLFCLIVLIAAFSVLAGEGIKSIDEKNKIIEVILYFVFGIVVAFIIVKLIQKVIFEFVVGAVVTIEFLKNRKQK